MANLQQTGGGGGGTTLTGTGLARQTGACTELSGVVATSGSNVTTLNLPLTIADTAANADLVEQNTTTATSGTTNASPTSQFTANYWTGAASSADTWTLGSSLAAGTNGASTLTLAHSGTTGVAGVQVPKLSIGTTPTGNPLEILLPAVGSTSYLKITGTGATFSTRLGSTFYGNQYDWFTNIAYNGSSFAFDDATKSAWRMHHLVATTDATSEFGLDYWTPGNSASRFPFSILGTGQLRTPSNGVYAFSSANNTTFDQSVDTGISRVSAAVVGVGNGAQGDVSGSLSLATSTHQSANGAQWVQGQASELLTLSTSGLTTLTTATLLPANAIIEAVVCRVTTTITTTTNWAVGDATTTSRFSSANATLTAGTTSVGLNHWSGAVTTLAAGPSQAAAAKVQITCTGSNPGAGAIRITVFYRSFVAPTS